VVAYSPFGQGRFRSHAVLEAIARAHGATPRQVALAFLVRQEAVFAIPKAIRLDHVAENAGTGDLRLSDSEISAIGRAFPLPRPRRGYTPML
jgi:diketogulonate reductase-like aldo/keto reductase